MRKRLKKELFKNFERLSQLRNKPVELAGDIKRSWVDLRSFTKKHLTGLLKGKHNVSQFAPSVRDSGQGI
jgi:hypothetical protein